MDLRSSTAITSFNVCYIIANNFSDCGDNGLCGDQIALMDWLYLQIEAVDER